MTQAAIREISVFEYLGGFRTTLLEQVFCSEFWLERCCREIETPDGTRVRVDRSIYPPGGKAQTAMSRCGVCKRWTPPDGTGQVCADCLTEAEVEAFEQRMRRAHQRGDGELVSILLRMHWRRLPIRHRKDEEADKPPDETAFLPDGLAEDQDDSLSPGVHIPFEYQTTSGRHWLAEALDMPEKPAIRRPRWVVGSAIRRHLLWVGRSTTRRAFGCRVVLLPDDDESLREEIAHYETKGFVMPRAGHHDTVSPLPWYRRPPSRRTPRPRNQEMTTQGRG